MATDNSPEDRSILAAEEVISKLTQKIEESLFLGQNFLNRRLPTPAVDFSLRGKSAGQMCAKTSFGRTNYTLRLNLTLAREHISHFLAEIVPHEVAHLMVMHQYGLKKTTRVRPHGPQWQQIMRQCFGLTPQIYHELQSSLTPVKSKRKLATFSYSCGCMEHELTSIRHKRAKKGTRYTCLRCHGLLRRIGLSAHTHTACP